MNSLIDAAMAKGPPDYDAVFVIVERNKWDSCDITVHRFGDDETTVAHVHIDLTVSPWPHFFPFIPMLTGETLEVSWPERMEFTIPDSIIY